MTAALTDEEIAALTHRELREHLRLAKVNPGHYVAVSERLESEAERRSPVREYRCLKCGHDACEVNELRAAASFLTAFLSVDDAKYTAVVCKRCAFSEFYQGDVSGGQVAVDLVFGR